MISRLLGTACGIGLLIAAALSTRAAGIQQVVRCQPPLDTVRDCPEIYMPTPVVPANTDSVWTVIRLAQVARDDERAQRGVVASAEAALKNNPGDNERNAYLAAIRALKPIVERKYALYNEAIARTAVLYGLIPPTRDFSSDQRLPDSHRSLSAWEPRFSDNEIYDRDLGKYRKRNAAELQPQAVQATGGVVSFGVHAGLTWERGRIRIFENAFENERHEPAPDNLALIIYHETSHWLDMVAEGRYRFHYAKEHFLSEQKAYARQAQFAKWLGLQAASQSAQAVADRFGAQAARVGDQQTPDEARARYPSWLHGSIVRSDDVIAEPDEAVDPNLTRSVIDFVDNLDQLSPLAAQDKADARAALAESERLRLEREARETAEWWQRQRELEAERLTAWKAIVNIAQMACDLRVPAADTNSTPSGNLRIDYYALEGFLSQAENGREPKERRSRLSRCQISVLKQFLKARGPITFADWNRWGQEYRTAVAPPPPPPKPLGTNTVEKPEPERDRESAPRRGCERFTSGGITWTEVGCHG